MTTLLLCYDGSDEARHAVVEAAHLFPGAKCVALNVWRPVEMVAVGWVLVGVAAAGGLDTTPSEAEALAREAAELARAHGLTPVPITEPMAATVWQTVLAAADQLGVDLIVTGGRGFTGVHEFVAGSLSHRLTQHSRRPVLVIPSAGRAPV